ncbi:MAG: gamma-glutamyltransferase [Rhodospirillales bacterium]|jgi:gamma-glutamyltranspeptidase / glutathione hydrolase|nr:gamma-glutamyltransferase [Rhodospirillales bacterium]
MIHWPYARLVLVSAGILLVVAGGCGPAKKDGGAPVATTAQDAAAKTVVAPEAKPQPEEPGGGKVTQMARAKKHMVAAANPLAAEAARQILRDGGSAVDAAIAAQMVLNLVEPQSSGIGGGGFMMHFAAESGDIAAYDGRETAPAGATPGMFLKSDGKPKKFYDAVVGGQSVGVPGLLRMLETAHKEQGKLPWAKLFEPAIRMAEGGLKVSERLHTLIAKDKYLKTFPDTAAYFHDTSGEALPVGHKLVNKPFAATLREIAEKGADAFYYGPIAVDIAKTVREATRNPGSMQRVDVAGYEAVKRDAVCLFYRLWMVCGMPPPSSGGVSTLQMIGLLQGYDLSQLEPASTEAVHLIAEAGRLAFADRNTYIADPDFIPVPTDGMLDPSYLELRAKEISKDKSIGPAFPGMPGVGTASRLAPDTSVAGLSTTHLSVIDGAGNAVSMTTSIESAFGSRLMVRGFLLNNQLTDFSFAPEKDGVPVANAVAPRKRPRSSMAPTLVFGGDGKVVMAVGSPGGSRIIGYVAKTLIAALDWNMDIQQAIDLPHFVNRNGKTDLEKGTAVEALAPALTALGHEVNIRDLTSGLHGIKVVDGELTGGADPRREGVALGD